MRELEKIKRERAEQRAKEVCIIRRTHIRVYWMRLTGATGS